MSHLAFEQLNDLGPQSSRGQFTKLVGPDFVAAGQLEVVVSEEQYVAWHLIARQALPQVSLDLFCLSVSAIAGTTQATTTSPNVSWGDRSSWRP